jgi:hypothetical protein
MSLTVTSSDSELTQLWAVALGGLDIRHPNGRSEVELRLMGEDRLQLYVGLDQTWCTLTGARKAPFAISTVTLTYWPGSSRISRAWFAAAWAGYCQHEALELVTLIHDWSSKVLDPHAEPYISNPANRGLRDGFPVELTPTSLLDTLALVMPRADAVRLVEAA